MENDRLQKLQQMLEKNPSDTFLLYGIALEHKKRNEPRKAIELLDRVIQLDEGYCYAYHQKGLTYESMDEIENARQAYKAGIAAAEKTGDAHAKDEITAALQMLE